MSDFVRCRHDVHGGEADISAAAVASGSAETRGWVRIGFDPPPLSADKQTHVNYAASLDLPTVGTKQQVMDRIAAHTNDLPASPEDPETDSGDAGESDN